MAVVHHGDCREVMDKRIPERSVQVCVTSPPYWGLRDYGLPPSIWGGEAECAHEWAPTPLPRTKNARQGVTEETKHPKLTAASGKAPHGDFCHKCGAWRGCLGLEPTPEMFVANIVEVFRSVWRVLRDDGTLWLNLGDSYAGSGKAGSSLDYQKGHTQFGQVERKERLGLPTGVPEGLKAKDLVGIPWMVAFALRADGWYLRQEIIWAKGVSFCPNYAGSVMPESCMDRPTCAHEKMFLFTKQPNCFYDIEAVKEDGAYPAGTRAAKGSRERKGKYGVNARPPEYAEYSGKRNLRNVWTIPEPMYQLRPDLSPEVRARVIGQLLHRGVL